MLIDSVELENIRSYKNLKLDFLDGINFLSGDIGSGKSSILQAIEFALFGFKKGDLEGIHLLRKGENSGSIKLVLKNESLNERIEIFRKIKKSKSGSISQENGYIKLNNNLIELSPTEINYKIFDLLNFPMSFISKDRNLVYRFTIYTPQEQLKEVLFADSEKRLEIIRKIFNIDKYKQLKDAIQIYSSRLRELKIFYSSKIENENEVKSELENLLNENELNSKNLDELNKELNLIEKKKEKEEEKLINLNEKIEKFNQVINKIKNYLSRIEEFEEEIKLKKKKLELKSKELGKNNLVELNNNLKEIEKLRLDYKNKIEEFELKKNEIEKKINSEKEFKNELDILEEKLNSLNKLKFELEVKNKEFDITLIKCKIKDLSVLLKKKEIKFNKLLKIEEKCSIKEKNNIELEINIKNLEKEIEIEMNKLLSIKKIDICPTCLQKINLDHIKKLESSNKDLIDKLNLNLIELKTKFEKNNDEILNFKNDLKEFENLEKEIFSSKEKINLLKEEEEKMIEKEKEINILNEKIQKLNSDELNKKIKELKLILNEFDLFKKKKEDILKEISKFEKEDNELKINFLEINSKIKNYNSLSKEVKELEEEIKKITNKIKLKDDLIEKLNKNNSNLKKYKSLEMNLKNNLEKIRNDEKNISVEIGKIKTLIGTNLKQIKRNELVLRKNEEYKKRLDKILNYIDLLNNRLSKISSEIEKVIFMKFYIQFNEEFVKIFKELIEDNEIEIKLNDDFSIAIEQNGYDIDIKNLSGGEKSSLALAYRLALKKVIEDNISNESKLSLLILDEPTDGFSNEQVSRLGNILKKSGLNQIILVSHDEKIKTISDNLFYIEKRNHESRVI